MAKRIVSGIFILTALGALGVILAGAMTSGEQLIVRFLTAVTVAALALYVISDLRLQSEEEESAKGRTRSKTAASTPQSATAVMATVTGSHRTGRTLRRRETESTPTPNFEAIEPVTASARIPVAADPTGVVTGSRLVPPSPGSEQRTVSPHPMAATPFEDSLSVPVPADASTTLMEPASTEDPTDQSDVSGLDQDRPPAFSTASAIATTTFTYSGRLQTGSVEWPPKPPEPTDRPLSDDEDGHEAELVAIDAPTAELPALRDPDPSEPATPEIEAVDEETAEPETPEVEAAGPPPGAPVSPLRQIEAAQYAAPHRAEVVDLRDSTETFGPATPRDPVPASPVSGTHQSDKLTAAIRSGELQVVNSLISQGMLSTDGPITDRDVRTMVYVAFTSNELRKLILAGGTPDGIRAGDLDLGEVELFDESRFAPPPKRLYSGAPTKSDDGQDLFLDLVALEEESAARLSSDSAAEQAIDPDDSELVHMLPTPSHLYRRADAESRVEQ